MAPLRQLKYTRRLRTAVFVAGDLLIWTAALTGAVLIRFDGILPPDAWMRLAILLYILLPIKLTFHIAFRLYHFTWRLVGLTDVINAWVANTLASLVGTLVLLMLHSLRAVGLPKTILLLDYVFSAGAIVTFRMSRRFWGAQRDIFHRNGGEGKRILLVGAGTAGERLVRAMRDDPQGRYNPIGFIDDDTGKHGAYIHGLRVFGGRETMRDAVHRHRVDELIIAIPSATSSQLRGIVEAARSAEMKQVRILPGVHELLSARAGLQNIRDVNMDDLLGRDPVRIDMEAIGAFLAGKRVLVTGAAGSIGSEIVRQLTRFDCTEVLALDSNESGLFELEETMRTLETSVPVRTIVADIRDREKVGWIIRTFQPAVLFHAAAYKHVPLMERHVEEAIKTNVLGTLTVAEAAVRARVERFILISTDKAVNPVSVLGLTKRVAEQIAQSLSNRGSTRFFAVRFGNVLGSRGSLVPVLKEQIRRGGPVTVTHPEMRRFFMNIAEAVLLVLQVALMDRQTGIFVLDMGQPVRIVDLATEMIRLSGLEPDRDVPIVFTGIRPGEKLEEELAEPDESLLPTPWEKILEIRPNGVPSETNLRLALQELDRLAREMDAEAMHALLSHLALHDSTLTTAVSAASSTAS